ncbi:hypothetical protein [Brevundimonas sp.]|uniref:hypothetical protein n=1 Tax=Brevundimonas sp. TaxID=1871086 RepID=UPI0028A17770|nr:hypothetical protein [Brevundimonas sp.]
MSDPFRQNAPSATAAEETALIEQGPVSRGLGQSLTFEESQITGRVLGFLQSDDRRAFDAQRARVFGREVANELSADAANAAFGVDNYLRFDQPVNAHRAAEMNRQAVERRYREETASRAGLSTADTLGASLLGAATDPVLLPTWFIGGGSAAVRAMGATRAATRLGNVGRGAVVGSIDGLTGGAVAEGVTFGARRSTGEDYSVGDSVTNIVLGVALGSTIGGGTGALTRPSPSGPAIRPTTSLDRQIAAVAEGRGVDASLALRIRQLENRSGDPQARPIRRGKRLSSAHGVFQITDRTWDGLGGGDRNDVARQVELGVENIARERDGLRQALGRDPAHWEVYLAHQQGQGGARALLGNPDGDAIATLAPVLERSNPGRGAALARQAVLNNGGRVGMTSGQFAQLWRRKFGARADAGAATLEQMTPRKPPRVLEGLTEQERVGAFAQAIEQIADDAPVDLGAALARNGLDALDEASAVPSIRGRWLEADVAVTRAGGEIPVRFAVVELDDLETSHSDDLTAEPAYPQALQPRDRSRAGSQAANYALERDLNPDLLMKDKAASGGSPIISPDGVVESGNGRAIALRRSANTGTEAWTRYRQALERQGFDVEGFDRPVLVRMRTEPMTGAQRAEMARAVNEAPTEAFSPVEQARSDARRLDRDTLGLLQGDDPFAAAERPFLRGFIQRVAPGEANALTDARGAISQAGRARVQAALVQSAYGDDLLTAALFENADDLVRGIGRALADAAPAWARMRAEAPRAMDVTPNLTGAVGLIREARAGRMTVAELLDARLGQIDLFGGEAISPETEAMVRLMFRDAALTKPRGSERIAEALKDYARGAAATPDGPDLFGDVPDGRAFLDTLITRYAGAEGEGVSGLAYAGGSEPLWSPREVEADGAAVLDLRPAEPDGDGPRGGGDGPEDGGRPARSGGQAEERLTPQARVAALIAADPELKALMADTDALARASGVDIEPPTGRDDPSTVAEAVRAAAFCLATEFGA